MRVSCDTPKQFIPDWFVVDYKSHVNVWCVHVRSGQNINQTYLVTVIKKIRKLINVFLYNYNFQFKQKVKFKNNIFIKKKFITYI